MSMMVLFGSIAIAVALVGSAVRAPEKVYKIGGVVAAVVVVFLGVLFSSMRFVGSDQIGIVKKNALGSALTEGRIIATSGEMGVQAGVLSPGWHPWYWPVIYDVSTVPLIEIKAGQIGLVEAIDGAALPAGEIFAPEAVPSEFEQMVNNASHFLAQGGMKGPQATVLKVGKHRVNTALFNVEIVPETDVPNASVAVLKSNFGSPATLEITRTGGEAPLTLAGPGERGVLAAPLPPGKHPINTKAYEVTIISTKETIVRFTKLSGLRDGMGAEEEREIMVRTSDGFTFPVDVRIEYLIAEADAPIVVAGLRDEESMRSKLNSTVRAIFRNNAEGVRALDYVSQRSQQESQSLAMLQEQMARVGVTITGVRIGDVGDEETLGELLKTQRDREIATQEQITFQEQQKAAEQKKELTRTEQEAEEERRLATATYEVKIAEQDKEKRLIAASAEAEAIKIEAEAQAEAFKLISAQIGRGNAAMVEVLKIIGAEGIQITPRVMVTGGNNGIGPSSEMVALIGTMLDQMVSDVQAADTEE